MHAIHSQCRQIGLMCHIVLEFYLNEHAKFERISNVAEMLVSMSDKTHEIRQQQHNMCNGELLHHIRFLSKSMVDVIICFWLQNCRCQIVEVCMCVCILCAHKETIPISHQYGIIGETTLGYRINVKASSLSTLGSD